jgi:hypothetical protein
MREYMSSSPTHSPPHRDTPLADADSAASGRNRYLSGRQHARVRMEEEVRCNHAEFLQFSTLCRVLACQPYTTAIENSSI